jgi:hypothetical protein
MQKKSLTFVRAALHEVISVDIVVIVALHFQMPISDLKSARKGNMDNCLFSFIHFITSFFP